MFLRLVVLKSIDDVTNEVGEMGWNPAFFYSQMLVSNFFWTLGEEFLFDYSSFNWVETIHQIGPIGIQVTTPIEILLWLPTRMDAIAQVFSFFSRIVAQFFGEVTFRDGWWS